MDKSLAIRIPTIAEHSLTQRLRMLERDLPENGIAVHQLVARLGSDATMLILLLLGLGALVPSPGLPLGLVCGSAVVLIALHLMLGFRDVPSTLGRRRIPRRHLATLLIRALPWIERVEKRLRPRLGQLLTPGALRFWAVAFLLMGVLIALPIPFGNPLPGIAVVLLALGFMSRDGLALLAGLACGAFATVWGIGIIALGAELTTMLQA